MANFHLFWFKFGTKVIGKPLNRIHMLKVGVTIFRPTNKINLNQQIAKIINFSVFRLIWMKFGVGDQKQNKMSLKVTIFDFVFRPIRIWYNIWQKAA